MTGDGLSGREEGKEGIFRAGVSYGKVLIALETRECPCVAHGKE